MFFYKKRKAIYKKHREKSAGSTFKSCNSVLVPVRGPALFLHFLYFLHIYKKIQPLFFATGFLQKIHQSAQKYTCAEKSTPA